MTSQFLPQWTVPDPPPSDERMRPGMVVVGIGVAVLGHVVAGVIGVAGFVGAVGGGPFRLMLAGPVAEAILGLVCLPVSIAWMTRHERGFGIGLLIGWVIGLMMTSVLVLFLFAVYWGQGPGT
ncbi:hypothetical protein K1W54_16955 [Micromonospora sp. CPCC 205371]|nr:hypothetical protein [Micromonospora sp. CPCC 205371]